MVFTQLQLKWPNHSTHLLTRLTYLFKNEQLVDCTLMCNKHSLKVHRSVLAACSPYFERELKNNPSIVVKDMQFSVLQALIEFMYYGETRITEENLTSLIEAAKLFEVKGLSDMDLIKDKNGIISSVVAVNSDCIVESSCLSDEADNTFEVSSQMQKLSSNNAPCQLNHFAYDDSQDVMVESTSAYEPHSSRNFVITPPQTESAQILLSLARSHSQKQFDNAVAEITASSDGIAANGFLSSSTEKAPLEQHSINQIFTDHNLILGELPPVNGNLKLTDMIIEETKPDVERSDGGKSSLLAKLLTRGSKDAKTVRYDDNYRTLYDNDGVDKSKSNELASSIILECPFLIETNEGYVDVSVENMLNALESGEMFDTNGKNLKILSKEEVCPGTSIVVDDVQDAVLERIKHDMAANEFKDDPEAVVLCKVGEDGRLEKYVLSSADVKALKEMNERIRAQQQNSQPAHIAEIEIPLSTGDTPLITRILDCGSKVENAISRLPFRRAGYLGASRSAECTGILEAPPLSVDAHHHENMFEELDSQFNMDCSIDNIQRDYVAYEEASKNETQLEHNYYANAMKDEDEECVVISDNYDLRMMMMVEETEEQAKAKRRTSLQIMGADDVCLNGYQANGQSPPKVNGARIVNGKCDLIINNDALMSSVLTAVPGVKTKRTFNGVAKNVRASGGAQSNVLPFRSVKSANAYRNSPADKKPKRTYKRKAPNATTERKRNGSLSVNGAFCNESNLIEEIIVDEIS